jgi:hypothetical protein
MEDDGPSAAASPRRTTSRTAKRSGASGGSPALGSKAVEVMAQTLPWLLKAEAAVQKVVEVSYPVYVQCVQLYAQGYKQLEPYGPEDLIKMATGLCMMFFGGFFITTVAVFEAFDQSGRHALVKNLRLLAEQAEDVREADERDDALDENKDGINDVQQISAEQLSVRKFLVVIRAADPNIISEALSNLYSILMAVLATLQVKFARAISLGAAIGNVLSKTTLKFIVPPLKEVMPEEMHKWLPVVATYICRLVGVSIALSVNRVLSTVHTAVRGARLATDGFTGFTERRNLLYLSEGYVDDAVALLLAALGVYGQLFVWARLPFIIKLLFFPATLLEWVLSFLVSASVARGTATTQQAQGFHGQAATPGGAAPGPP